MIIFLKQTPKIDYLSKKIYFIGLSGIFAVLSLFSLVFYGLNLGLDFRGGTQIRVRLAEQQDPALLTQQFGQIAQGVVVSRLRGSQEQNDYLFVYSRLNDETQDAQASARSWFDQQGLQAEILSVETIGPKIGAELKQNAWIAVVLSLGLILIYMAFRFAISYGLGAIVALFHDTLITVGAFSLFRVEFDLTALAGILTLIGYSMNDTIVVFDRARENRQKHPSKSLAQVINLSVNETMSRTLLTFFTTFIIVLAMFLFGGNSIFGFSFAFLVGIIVGTYSSVFIASPVFIWFEQKNFLQKQPQLTKGQNNKPA